MGSPAWALGRVISISGLISFLGLESKAKDVSQLQRLKRWKVLLQADVNVPRSALWLLS